MAEYQKFTPGVYFDWEQPMVNQRLEQFAEYQKKPDGELFETITLTEEEIVRHNKMCNLYDPLYIDTEYARAHGHPGCPALPGLFCMPGHPMSPIDNFPHNMGDRFFYTAIGGDLRYQRPIYAGDKVLAYSAKGRFWEATEDGGNIRKWRIRSSCRCTDENGRPVGGGDYDMIDSYTKIVDGSPVPSQSEQLAEWTSYYPPAHYTTDEDYAYIRKLWNEEVRRGDQKLFWEDVPESGDIPGICSDGPLTYMHIVCMHPAPIEFLFTREELSDPNYTADLYRDQYGQYLDQTALHYGGRNIPGSRAVFYNHTLAYMLMRVVTNYVGDYGRISRLQWELFPFSRELQTNDVGAATLAKVPYMKGKSSLRHGGEGDTCIGHGYITGKRIDPNGDHVVEFAVWGETLDGDIIQVCEMEAVLPSRDDG